MMRALLAALTLISFSAAADTYSELNREGSRAQALLDSIASKAASGKIHEINRLCPSYLSFNGDRTKRSLVWSKIIESAGVSAEAVLASVDANNSVVPVMSAMMSASKRAAVESHCRGLPVPNAPKSQLAPIMYVAEPGLSTNRIYKIPDPKKGDFVMWDVGVQSMR
jgi:hypothetical protein